MDHNKLWEILKEIVILDCLTCLQRNLYVVKKQQVELDMKQLTDSKLGSKYDKAVYCYSTCLTYTQSTAREMLSWMNHKLESRLPGEILTTLDTQMAPPLWQKAKKN